ncbi:NADPH-dependent FMN reductase [Streptomyces silvisoli]|uniref:NAD(P)H-dependent oxidoreductase n=1 Tax=Streptomyces silvisoli TaxID=3034235 RepID=A0ABT5ZMN7_9ACTN|nr:NADPH-dependent FMN reductase [Streptomyces silvisoli]MDF3290830.1 NAD(P)H-dependent oxidoreductase [Streptomyces silvisoli]
MTLLAISGSLRAASSNGVLLGAVLELARAGGWDGTAVAGIGELPLFNPDLDGVDAIAPEAVDALRQAVARADAVVIVSPEYAHGVPGALKNALDWLVSSAEFVDKPVAVITASASGGAYANAQLRETLRMMTATVVEGACLTVPGAAAKIDHATGDVTDDALREELRGALGALRTAVRSASAAAD